MRKGLVVLGVALALLAPLWAVVAKERVLAHGRVVLLELGPRDPRSLLQGDYMALRYAIAAQVPEAAPRDGRLVVRDDGRGVATFARVHGGEPLAEGEGLLRYRVRGRTVRLGAESFLFEEGSADALSAARFGELRVDEDGDAVLVGLRDAELRPLGVRP